MLRIGEFSRLSQVTAKALRYYDEIGLFRPAQVDGATGYRYYSASQLPRLHRILALKEMGLSLSQITQLLQDDLTPEEIRGMLRLKRAELEGRLQEAQAQLARVERRLTHIEQEGIMSAQEVVLKEIPATQVASIRAVIANYQAIGQLFGELFGHLGRQGVTPAGPAIGIYHDEEYREEDVDVEAAVPVPGRVSKGGRVTVRELPAVEQMACIVHQGSFDDLSETYGQLMAWIEANGYRPYGPSREVYLQMSQPGEDPSGNVTEIQFPVAKG